MSPIEQSSSREEDGKPEVYVVTYEATTVTFVCAELRKLHVHCCGMPHEDKSRNPSGATCGNVKSSYNLACVHSYAGIPVLQAYEMACRRGYAPLAKTLWDTFEHLQQKLDLVDSEGGVLYSISSGALTLDSDRAESAVRRLQLVDVDHRVALDGGGSVQKEITSSQHALGMEMLRIRDAFLILLESELLSDSVNPLCE